MSFSDVIGQNLVKYTLLNQSVIKGMDYCVWFRLMTVHPWNWGVFPIHSAFFYMGEIRNL